MFVFQYLLHLTDYSILFGCNRIYFCKFSSYGNLNFKNITEVDAVRGFTS